MSFKVNGELIPEGGGDNIPLIRPVLTMGRRDSCDIPLRLPNVSGTHCELAFVDGFWWIKDLNSTNGVKVNGIRVPKKLLLPGEKFSIAKKTFTIEYKAPAGKAAENVSTMQEEDVLGQSLLERAGLAKPGSEERRRPPGAPKRPDPLEQLGGDDDDDGVKRYTLE